MSEEIPVGWRTFDVAYPWAWCWWPADQILVDENPDVTDRRPPRSISTLAVDWSRILRAVRYAVNACPLGPEALDIETFQVEVPWPLTDLEYDIASSWVGTEPVIYSYENDILMDGRHRLWFTKEHLADQPVPIVAENLIYLADAREGGPTASILQDVLETALHWWSNDPVGVEARSANSDHLRHLAQAYLWATTPAALPRAWFQVLATEPKLVALQDLHVAGRTDRVLLARTLPFLWRYKPDNVKIDPVVVLDMFRALAGGSGFTMWGHPARRPRGTLTLYRGATQERRCGISWTSRPGVAGHFAAHRQEVGEIGTVWTLQVPATRCLAFYADEEEFIVDVAGLEDQIRPAPAQPAVPRMTRLRVKALARHEHRFRRQALSE